MSRMGTSNLRSRVKGDDAVLVRLPARPAKNGGPGKRARTGAQVEDFRKNNAD